MDLITKISIDIEKKDGDNKRVYSFLMPYGSPCGQAYDACFEVLQEIRKMAERIENQAKRNPQENEEKENEEEKDN